MAAEAEVVALPAQMPRLRSAAAASGVAAWRERARARAAAARLSAPLLLACVGLVASQVGLGLLLAAVVRGLDSTLGGWFGAFRIVINPA